jgi:hypothetical protein
MPNAYHNRGSRHVPPASPNDGAKDLAELSLSGTAEYDPLAGGRGLVFGLLFSTVLFCGIVALAILIWAH